MDPSNVTICARCRYHEGANVIDIGASTYAREHRCQSRDAVDPITGNKWGDTMWGFDCRHINHGDCPYYEEKE